MPSTANPLCRYHSNVHTAVVRKDSEAYHQWTTYWLILHIYITILSPFLHLTLHPIFQILAILWLSLPRFQGASVVYERVVVPLVDRHETKIDDSVAQAHRGVRRWVLSRLGRVVWMLIGEGGSLAEGLLHVIMGFLGVNPTLSVAPAKLEGETIKPPPQHSIKEALSRSSSIEELEEVGDHRVSDSFDPTDFITMLQQGLYVFAQTDADSDASRGVFKLCIFSYTKDENAFSVSPVEVKIEPVKLPLDGLKATRSTGSRQGLLLECHRTNSCNKNVQNNVSVEIVLSDESDRDILLNGLNACLPHIFSQNE